MTDVATAADVSRRTVFLYFPTFDQLLIDATVGALSEPRMQDARQGASNDDDPEARVERLVRALHHVTPDIERLGRALVRATVDAPGSGGLNAMPKRGYRRIEWIESGLAPLRSRLDLSAVAVASSMRAGDGRRLGSAHRAARCVRARRRGRRGVVGVGRPCAGAGGARRRNGRGARP